MIDVTLRAIDETLRAQLVLLLYDLDDTDHDVFRDFWITRQITQRCCGSHVPQWMQFPWAFCHCCHMYAMPDNFELFTKERID